MLARLRELLKPSLAPVRRLFNSADSELPEGQTRELVRETLGLFGWLALIGSLITFSLGLSAHPALTVLGIGFSGYLFLMRWLAARLSERLMAMTFLAGALLAAGILANSLQTIQSVHMLLLALPLIFTTFIYGPMLGLGYGAGIGLISLLIARNETRSGTEIRFDPYSQAWVLFEILLMIFVLTLGLRRYVAIAHRKSSEVMARQARADGAAPIQARLAMALHAGRFGVWEFNQNRSIAVLDDRALELLGLPAHPIEIPVSQWLHRILPADRSMMTTAWNQWLCEQEPMELRFRVTNRLGELRWVRLDVRRPPKTTDEKIVGVLADVTDDMALRSQMQDALRRADQAAAAAKAYFFELDLRSGHLSRDPGAERLVGLPTEETSRGLNDLFSNAIEPTRSRALAALDETLRSGGASFDYEVAVISDGPVQRFFRSLIHIERDTENLPMRIYGMSMEVTESRRVRRDLERITSRFKLAVEAGNLGVWQFNLKSQLITQTAIGVALFDLPSDQPINAEWYVERILPEDREMVKKAFRDTIGGGGGFEIVYRIQARGATRWVRSAGRLENNDRGAPARLAGVNWDITNDIEAREQLSRINNRLGLALSAANASVWEYDSTTKTVTWDERARDLYGVDPNPAGSRIDRIFLPDRASLEQELKLLFDHNTEDSFVVEYRIAHPTRDLRWIRCIGHIDRRSEPDRLVSVGIDIDVTAERTATDAIEKARQVAEAANRAKSTFLANMSHEIRTPMNAIIGMTELAHRAASLPQASSYSAQAHSAARGLLTVLNDVLDFSKIEAGRLDLESIRFPVEDVLGLVLDVATFGAAEKKLELILDVGANVRSHYYGDPARIGQILHNLANNAIKFTEYGSIRINVLHTNTGQLRFEVVDTGCGISARQLEDIFEPFAQGDLSTSRRFGGTGLGLSISRRLADLMHAELGVASESEHGASFWLELPQPATSAGTNPEALLWEALPDPSPKVFLLHHSKAVRQSLALQLDRQQTDWQELSDLAVLQQQLRDAAPNSNPVALIDRHWLPVEATTWLKDIRNLPCHPHAVLLGRMLSDMPVDEPVLLEAALPSQFRQVLLTKQGSTSGSGHRIGVFQGSNGYFAGESLPHALAGIEILLAEDNDLNRALVQAILSESGASVRIAENGIEAVQAVMHRLPDVLLMDVHMPLMDGYKATAAIRALGPGGRNLPILAITADALLGDHDKTLRAGMNDHLTKPIDRGRLLSALHRWTVGRHTNLPASPNSNPPASRKTIADNQQSLPDAVLIDFAAGICSCQGDPESFARGLKIFVSIYSDSIRPLLSQEPMSAPSLVDDFRRLVHNLNGSVRLLGMFPLADLAAKLDAELQLHDAPDPAQQAQLLACLQATLNNARAHLASLQQDDSSVVAG